MNDQDIYSVLIAEDEIPARELLIDYITSRSELKLAGVAKNGQEALDKLQSEKFDLLFLDIHLPVLTGLEVIEQVEDLPHIVFTTAYDKYAIKAFDFGAIDYLLKPFSLERFNQAVDKFIKQKTTEGTKKTVRNIGLSFKEDGKHYLLPYNEIIYLSSHGKHTIIHTEEKDFETTGTLKDIEAKLDGDIFVRIHKQHVTNIQFVSHIEYNLGGQYIAYLKDPDETSLPVGRTFAPNLKEKLSM